MAARSCILIFQWGGPSQLDTWDPKPDAPADIRGEFGTIDTRTPGVRISEHFPLLAAQTHRMTIIRSMSHDDPAHLSTAHRLLTGHLAPTPYSDAAGPSANDWPHLGAILAKCRPSEGVMPHAVTMPWSVAHPAAPGGKAPGQHGGWLGKEFDPFAVEGDRMRLNFQVSGLGLPEGVTSERMADRRALFDALRDPAGLSGRSAGAWDGFQAGALDALASAQAREAFQIERRTRGFATVTVGISTASRSCPRRRLVEAGVGLVTVNWHNDGLNSGTPRGDNFNNLKNRLMPCRPRFRRLARRPRHAWDARRDPRGLGGEFGRTPRITKGNAGREHWPRCYSRRWPGAGSPVEWFMGLPTVGPLTPPKIP